MLPFTTLSACPTVEPRDPPQTIEPADARPLIVAVAAVNADEAVRDPAVKRFVMDADAADNAVVC